MKFTVSVAKRDFSKYSYQNRFNKEYPGEVDCLLKNSSSFSFSNRAPICSACGHVLQRVNHDWPFLCWGNGRTGGYTLGTGMTSLSVSPEAWPLKKPSNTHIAEVGRRLGEGSVTLFSVGGKMSIGHTEWVLSNLIILYIRTSLKAAYRVLRRTWAAREWFY